MGHMSALSLKSMFCLLRGSLVSKNSDIELIITASLNIFKLESLHLDLSTFTKGHFPLSPSLWCFPAPLSQFTMEAARRKFPYGTLLRPPVESSWLFRSVVPCGQLRSSENTHGRQAGVAVRES